MLVLIDKEISRLMSKRKNAKYLRGYLEKYKDPSKISLEESAWAEAVKEKYKKILSK